MFEKQGKIVLFYKLKLRKKFIVLQYIWEVEGKDNFENI